MKQTIRTYINFGLVILFTACSPAKLLIPSQFTHEATMVTVNKFGRKNMSFSNYKINNAVRGWNIGNTGRTGSFGERFIEDRLLIDFGISANNIRSRESGKFQFEVQDDHSSAEIFAREQRVTNNFLLRTDIDFLNNMSFIKNYEYSFIATILPYNSYYKIPWKLYVTNVYNAITDTTKKLFEIPTGNENGYASDGKDSIFIRPVFVKKSSTKTGKEFNIPVKIMGGYELQWEGGVVCIIDAIKRSIWMHNNLKEEEKFILSVIASTIILRRVQDIRQ